VSGCALTVGNCGCPGLLLVVVPVRSPGGWCVSRFGLPPWWVSRFAPSPLETVGVPVCSVPVRSLVGVPDRSRFALVGGCPGSVCRWVSRFARGSVFLLGGCPGSLLGGCPGSLLGCPGSALLAGRSSSLEGVPVRSLVGVPVRSWWVSRFAPPGSLLGGCPGSVRFGLPGSVRYRFARFALGGAEAQGGHKQERRRS
jgi:hypothetical protein